MTRLHIAAMPFPSVQGTQAAVRMMVDAEHEAGWLPELLTYAHGGSELRAPWPHHRIADLTRDRSLRSGPSLRKVFEDAQIAVAARRIFAKRSPGATIAHHVEAAAAAFAARIPEVVFFAHTALGTELPTYLPEAARRLAGRAGDALDVALARRAHRVAAISPLLAKRLADGSEREVGYVPVPFPLPPPIEPEERHKARHRFGIDRLAPVLLYAGNLDAYQGIEGLAEAFDRVRTRRPEARFLVATGSDRAPFEKALWASGSADHATFVALADEPDRRAAHAAADLAWVPRAIPGGLPMKLLDAMARGVPTVVTERATAGIDLRGAAMVVADDDPDALAAAALLVFEGRETARSLGDRGRDFVSEHHAPKQYLSAIVSL